MHLGEMTDMVFFAQFLVLVNDIHNVQVLNSWLVIINIKYTQCAGAPWGGDDDSAILGTEASPPVSCPPP